MSFKKNLRRLFKKNSTKDIETASEKVRKAILENWRKHSPEFKKNWPEETYRKYEKNMQALEKRVI